jgi:uncharacterized protein
MLVRSSATSFRTLDGLYLAGPFVEPDEPCDLAVVLVHGGGVTREEGGFFTRLAAGLGAAGVASLRFDLRGHGRPSRSALPPVQLQEAQRARPASATY